MARNTSAPELPRIPTEDLASWVFNGPKYDRQKPVRISFIFHKRIVVELCKHLADDNTAQILIDPANPSRSVSFNQARELVGKLATGFRRAGLRVGDCVLVNSGNDVGKP
jgi:non-ribosomal peptide synthetase component E (peptide arylation enzyme)